MQLKDVGEGVPDLPGIHHRLFVQVIGVYSGCRSALIHHEGYQDDRKKADLAAGDEDNAKLFEKWNLPEPGGYPDPRPGYLRMLAERGIRTV